MFRRDIFVLVAVALIGIVLTVYMIIGQTPFFPKALQATYGDCPQLEYEADPRRLVMTDFEADWFGSALLGFHEEPIFPTKSSSQRTVRFLILSQFHEPMMVRTAEMEDGRVRLIAKRMPYSSECVDDNRGCMVDRVLTDAEQRRLRAVEAPMLQRQSYSCAGGLDGSRWVVEGNGGGNYRFWNEWSPRTGALRELGLIMLELAGWTPESRSGLPA